MDSTDDNFIQVNGSDWGFAIPQNPTCSGGCRGISSGDSNFLKIRKSASKFSGNITSIHELIESAFEEFTFDDEEDVFSVTQTKTSSVMSSALVRSTDTWLDKIYDVSLKTYLSPIPVWHTYKKSNNSAYIKYWKYADRVTSEKQREIDSDWGLWWPKVCISGFHSDPDIGTIRLAYKPLKDRHDFGDQPGLK